MKEHIKSTFGLLFFYLIRSGERRLSVDALYQWLRLLIYPRAFINTLFKKSKPLPPLPSCFHLQKTRWLARQQRVDFYLNHLLDFFQDHFTEPKWKERIVVEGFEPLRQALAQKRPVVIVAFHFGPYYLSRMFLRSLGIPLMELLGGRAKGYTSLMKLQDRLAPFPEVPAAVYQDELRKMATLLADGNAVGIMMDTPFGKQMDIPFSEGWTFQMATGAVRIAMRHDAEIFPLTIIEEGRWRFRLVFGKPVPREMLAADADWRLAGRHILEECRPFFGAHPDHCLSDLTRCLKPGVPMAGAATRPANSRG